MDTSKAMALLGFSSARTFESTNMNEIQKLYSIRMHVIETASDPKRAAASTSPAVATMARQFVKETSIALPDILVINTYFQACELKD